MYELWYQYDLHCYFLIVKLVFIKMQSVLLFIIGDIWNCFHCKDHMTLRILNHVSCFFFYSFSFQFLLNMLQEKYIGLILAMSSSIFIGLSFVITKKGLVSSKRRHGNNKKTFTKNEKKILKCLKVYLQNKAIFLTWGIGLGGLA